MALFRYTALNHKGKKFHGVIHAEAMDEAQHALRNLDVFVVDISASTQKKAPILSRQEVLNFTRELFQLLNAALPLYESLKALADKAKGHKNHAVYLDICDCVKKGESFSKALSYYTQSFSSVYISMVEAAEESGSLASVFKELLQMLSKEDKLRKQLSSAMIYPIFLSVFCFIVIIGLFTFMIPSMKELLEGRQLHPFTQLIIGMSDWFVLYKWIALPSCMISVALIILFFKSRQGRELWDRISLYLPLIGSMRKQSIILKFSRTFASLLSNGVPIVKAIEMAAKVMNHSQYEAIMQTAKEQLIEGKSFSSYLASSSLIPPLFTKMVGIAEQTATLDQMLFSIADIYEAELDKSLQQFSTLIQPVMILLLGLIVGTVLLAVLLPLTDVSSFLT